METVTNQLVEVIAGFEKEQTRLNEETVKKLRNDHDKEINELNHKLEVPHSFPLQSPMENKARNNSV